MDRWSQLSLKDKSDLMSLYIRNGISSLEEIKKHYNNYQDGGKITFQQWKAMMKSKYPDIEMDNDKAGYNYEEYFNKNYDAAIRQLSNLQHFPDTYKLPNHPTFSNESIYSRGPNMGGNWINDSTFTPSVINRQYHPNIYKEDRNYIEREIYNSYDTGGKLGKVTPYGQWQYPGEVTTIPSNNITMKGVDYPVIGVSNTGDTKYMLPNMDYLFDGQYVTEYPVHKFQDGGPDDEDKIYAASSVYKAIPDINITTERPAWQRGLTNYDWARARQYYSNPDGTINSRGMMFLKDVASKRQTGTSNFMRDVNKLSYIPNAAVGAIGAIPATAGLIASAPVVAEAAAPYVVPTVKSMFGVKNLAGLGLSIGLATGVDQTISDNSDYNSLPDWANQTFFDGSPETERAIEVLRPEYMFAPYIFKGVNKGIRLVNNAAKAYQEAIILNNTKIKPSLNSTSYNFSIDDKRFINNVAGYSGYDVKNAMLKLRERFGDLIIPERWLDAPERAARMLVDNRLADFNMGLKTKFIPNGMNYDKINTQFQNLYFRNGEILPEFNNDITVTNIPKTTEAIINNQTLPRLMLDEDRKYLLGRSNSFVEDFTFDFDKALHSKYYWPSNELWNAFSMNHGKGGYYVPRKQRVVIPKEHSYTTPTHETIHSIEEQIPRTPSENKLLESYGSIPTGERGPTNAEVRQRVLDKMNVNMESSLKEQNNAIDKISDEDLIEILKITNGYAQKAVQNKSINKKSLSGIREAMKKVGAITGIIGTGAPLLNNNKN